MIDPQTRQGQSTSLRRPGMQSGGSKAADPSPEDRKSVISVAPSRHPRNSAARAACTRDHDTLSGACPCTCLRACVRACVAEARRSLYGHAGGFFCRHKRSLSAGVEVLFIICVSAVTAFCCRLNFFSPPLSSSYLSLSLTHPADDLG